MAYLFYLKLQKFALLPFPDYKKKIIVVFSVMFSLFANAWQLPSDVFGGYCLQTARLILDDSKQCSGTNTNLNTIIKILLPYLAIKDQKNTKTYI